MVKLDMGLPEPPETDTSISTNNDLVMPIDSDTEEEDNGYEGYERLPLREQEILASDDDEDTEEEDEIENSVQDEENAGIPNIVSMEEALVKEVWSDPKVKDIEMDSIKVNQVKEAMVNFTLPASNIPDWANNVPEENWKEVLLKRLQNK